MQTQKKMERVIGVKFYSPEISVYSEIVVHATTDEACGENMEKCTLCCE